MIGAGHAGTSIAWALFRSGHTFSHVYSRHMHNAQNLADKIKANAAIDALEELTDDADLYIFALPDDKIEQAFTKINFQFNEHQIVAHTSGSLPHNLFEKAAKNSGVLYFPQTMSKEDKTNLKHCPAIIQGSNPYTTKILMSVASGITENVEEMDDNQRKYLHISAIFSHNFTNYMYTIAEDICARHNIEFSMLYKLIDQGVEKMKKKGPIGSQTGPAARNDQKLIKQHLNLLVELPEYQQIYALLSANITDRHKKD